MKTSLMLIGAGLLIALGLGARASEPVVRPARPAMTPMVADVRVSLLAPRGGAKIEVRRVRVQGRVEATGGPATTARVEMGFRSGAEYLSSKTITARVGEEFSQWLELPGDGPYTFYIGVVKLAHVVHSENVGVRPRADRDLSRGSRLAVSLHTNDPRGRRLECRIAVYQGAALVGDAYTAGGVADLYDLARGDYTVRVTANDGGTVLYPMRVLSDRSVQVVTVSPAE